MTNTLPQPIFQENQVTPDPKNFLEKHPSDVALYNSLGDLLKKQTTNFNRSILPDDEVYSISNLYGARGQDVIDKIQNAGIVNFHMLGDSGSSASGTYKDELRVMDAMTQDYIQNASNASICPAFCYHVGDLVYNFGESKYYYDQFYDPFRNYPAPIVAIPGNHDSFIVPGTPKGEDAFSIFQDNFCSAQPTVTKEAGSLHRTSVSLPGVYYALDMPFCRIIGLFSNALEDPGIISSENGKWPNVPDYQLNFLSAQLQLIKDTNYKGAVILTMHHPAFTWEPSRKSVFSVVHHHSSNEMLNEIDTICAKIGVYPHAVISGHVHNYQRFTRKIQFNNAEYQVPFVICGNGGHHINSVSETEDPALGSDVSYLDTGTVLTSKGLILEQYEDDHFGYLCVSADQEKLVIRLKSLTIPNPSFTDTVTIDIANHTLQSA